MPPEQRIENGIGTENEKQDKKFGLLDKRKRKRRAKESKIRERMRREERM
jgi:hypothetical protein